MKKNSIIILIIAGIVQQSLYSNEAYVACGTKVVTFSTITNSVTGTITPFHTAQSIAITPNGKTAYVANLINIADSSIIIVDTATNSIVDTIPGTSTPPIQGVDGLINSLAITPDGTKMYATISNAGNPNANKVLIIDLAKNVITGSVTGTFNNPTYIAMTPDGSKAYIINLGTNEIKVIDVTHDSVSNTITGFNNPTAITAHPNGSVVYAANNNGPISIISVKTDNIIDTISDSTDFAQIDDLVITPDGTTLYVSNFHSGNNNVTVINTLTNTVSQSIRSSDFASIEYMAITPNGKTLYVCSANGDKVIIIDTGTNTALGPVNDPNSAFHIPTNIAIIPPLTPTSLVGYQTRNIFLMQTEFVNILKWKPPSNWSPTSYAIYRDAAFTDLAGTVSATSGQMTFQDHDRPAGTTYTYYIVPVNQFGTGFPPAIIMVNSIT